MKPKSKYLRIFAVLISVVMLLSVPAVAESASSYGFLLVAKTDELSMYADTETGHFSITDKNGSYFTSQPKNLDADEITKKKDKLSYGSQIIVDYVTLDGFTAGGLTSSANSTVACVNRGNINVEKIKSGIRVEYTFEDIGFVIPVEYTLSEDTLLAKVDVKNIQEGEECLLYRIHLLPSFGAADSDDSGYIFVPDGSGVLINFNNGADDNVYEAMVYGDELSVKKDTKFSNTETVRLPVFGLSKTDGGILGIITKGDTSSYVGAVVGNSSCGLNMAYSIMQYRAIGSDEMISQSTVASNIFSLSQQKYSLDSYEVEYKFLPSKACEYSDMAVAYRDYLIEEKGLKKNESDAVLSLDVYGALETEANFLGFKYKKLSSLTSYEDIEEIVNDLESVGIDDLSIRYIGWQNGGITNYKQLKKSKLLSVLGGRGDFRDMQDYLANKDISLWCDADLMLTRKGSLKTVAATMFNKKAWQYQYLPSVYVSKLTVEPWLYVNNTTLNKNSISYLKSLDKTVKNISLSTLTNTIYSDFGDRDGAFRTEIAKTVESVLKNYNEKGYLISGDNANAYAVPYLSKIYNAPTSTSGYKLFDKEIPFYQIVFHGYIPMTGAAVQTELTTNLEFLKAVETGSQILYNCIYEDSSVFRGLREEGLYSSTYTLWKERAARQYESYSALLSKVQNEPIIAHREVSKNVMSTTFADGTQVIVNYNKNSIKAGNIMVEACSFAVVGEVSK